MEWALAILSDLRWQDVVDILFLSGVVYCLYAWFWGTKALKALVGLLGLGAVFALARLWGLFLTSWVFQVLWQVAVLLVIILFQPELRQMLERVSPFRWLKVRAGSQSGEWISALVDAAFSLARSRIGAIVVVERGDRIEEWTTGGVPLHAQATAPLLVALFQKESPLHDGAVVVQNGELMMAGCYLPLSVAEGLPQHLGTRHRAALGISERCDALAVVVSEQRGRVSVARGGQVRELDRPEELRGVLDQATTKQASGGIGKRTLRALTSRLPAKAFSLVLVSAVWVSLAGKQDVEVRLSVPVETRNLPERWEIIEPHEPRVQLVLRGMRKDVMTLNDARVFAEVDLSLARLGRRTFRLGPNEIVMPNDRVQVVRIEPPEIKFRFQERS
jgi:diadenylate cyclase